MGVKKNTKEQLNEKIRSYNEERFEMTFYKSNKSNETTFRHKHCGKEFNRSWLVFHRALRNGNRIFCPCCDNDDMDVFWNTAKLSKKRISDFLSETEFEIIEYSGGNKLESLFKHKVCQKTFKRKWNVLHRGLKTDSSKCPHCEVFGDRFRSNKDKINNKIKGSPYELVGEYENSHHKTMFKHLTCGNEWLVTSSNIFKSIRLDIDSCPSCGERDGELAKHTKKVVSDLFGDFKSEWYVIKNPKTGKPLFFDIYIEKINTVIEVNGIQHYVKGHFNYTDEDFKELKFRDEFKKNWCIDNGVDYIEIDTRKHNKESVCELLTKLKTFND